MIAKTLNLTHELGVEQQADFRYRLPPLDFDLTGCEGRAQIRSFSGVLVGEFQVVIVRTDPPALIDLVLPASSVAPGIYLWDLLIRSPANESMKLYEGWVDVDAGATSWTVNPVPTPSPQPTPTDIALTQHIQQYGNGGHIPASGLTQESVEGLSEVIALLQQKITDLETELEQVKLDPSVGIVTPPLQAAISMSALRIVLIREDGMIEYADSSDASHAFDVVGILTESVQAGNFTRPLVQGVVETPGWNWTKGDPIYLDGDGTLTQETPTTGFMIVVGTPITATLIKFELQEPTLL